jgi:uncharacterized protein (TIGR02285 family)
MLKMAFALILMAFSAENQTLTWVYTTAVPGVSLPKANIVDERHPLIQLYHSEFRDYQQTGFSATVPRIEMELRTKKLVCFPGSSDATRRKEFTYLTPQYIQPAPHLVVRKELGLRLLQQNKNGISLKSILHDTSLKGLIGEARSYGNVIDTLISENQSNNLKKGVFETFSPNPLNMLEKGRADYTIEYPFILHNLKEAGAIGNDLMSIPLTDVGHSMTQYLACSRTPEGLAVIKRADHIIREHVKDPKFWVGVLESIPEMDRPAFQKEINKYVESRAKAPIIIE